MGTIPFLLGSLTVFIVFLILLFSKLFNIFDTAGDTELRDKILCSVYLVLAAVAGTAFGLSLLINAVHAVK